MRKETGSKDITTRAMIGIERGLLRTAKHAVVSTDLSFKAPFEGVDSRRSGFRESVLSPKTNGVSLGYLR